MLQVVVAQGGVFDVDLAHHAHAHLGRALNGNVPKSLDDPLEVFAHLGVGEALPLVHTVEQPVHALVNGLVRLPGRDLVGPDLVGGLHDEVAVHHGEDRLAQEGNGELEAGVLLQAGEVHRHHGHKLQSGFFQRLAQQVDVVGRPAAAARLRDEQSHLMYVVLAALHGVNELPDHQQRGITGVVVDVFLPRLHDLAPGGVQGLHLEPLPFQQPGHHPEVDGKHLGHEKGILLLHLLRKEKTPRRVVNKFSHGFDSFRSRYERRRAHSGLAQTSAQAGRKPARRAVFRETIWL